MRIRRRKHQKIATAFYSATSGRCGDSCAWTTLKDGTFAVALSDGMGKGEAAARDSARSVNAVIGMLRAGMDPELALNVLNIILTMDNRKERFPTMDLAILKPASRELYIYKTGAAPTMVIRESACMADLSARRPRGFATSARHAPPGSADPFEHRPRGIATSVRHAPLGSANPFVQSPLDSVSHARHAPPCRCEVLSAEAMPMGVSEKNRISVVSTMVMPGDKILMMTDGIADSCRGDYELQWIHRLMSRIKSRNLQTVCDLIIRESSLNYGDREKDDMTITVFEV